MIKIENVTFVKIDETDHKVTDSEIVLVKDIEIDKINQYKLISDDEISNSNRNNKETNN